MEGSLETLASGQEGWKPPASLAAPGWRMGLRPLGIWKLYCPPARLLLLPVLPLGSYHHSRKSPFLLLATRKSWRLRGE